MTDTAIIGQPLDRVDGPAKVTGAAIYAYETPCARAAFGYVVEGNGGPRRIRRIDTAAAEGVLAVLTYRNAPDQLPFGEMADDGRFAASKALLVSEQVRFHGDPVAVVIARSFEAARTAAHLVEVDIARDNADFVIDRDRAETPAQCDGGLEPDSDKGDFSPAFDAAEVRIDVTDATPAQNHAAMEPHGALAEVEGGKVTAHMSIQIVADAVLAIARTFRLDPADVRVISRFVGGGFGGSFGAATAGSALRAACIGLRDKLRNGADAAHPDGLSAEGEIKPDENHKTFAPAQFAEVEVDIDSCAPRVRRMLGVFSAGRILNPKTARSQLIGGMVFGIGAALMEKLQLDRRYGAYMNRDLAEYHLPVSRDVPAVEAYFREAPDAKSNPLGSKGVDELGICGAAACIGNAIFNATGDAFATSRSRSTNCSRRRARPDAPFA